VNILDVGVTYYAFHNALPVKEIGPPGASNLGLAVGFIFSTLVTLLCAYVVKVYKERNLKFKIFSGLIWAWAIFDTFVIINNFWVISQVLRS
jgi:hypothetical protein